MREGDRVRWQSQSQGYQKVKEGIIVAAIPSGRRPDPAVFPTLYKGAGPGYGRDHESYVVKAHAVDQHGRQKGSNAFYWPRASALRLIGDAEVVGGAVHGGGGVDG